VRDKIAGLAVPVEHAEKQGHGLGVLDHHDGVLVALARVVGGIALLGDPCVRADDMVNLLALNGLVRHGADWLQALNELVVGHHTETATGAAESAFGSAAPAGS
tara:strand:+ start:582 stop:893 length:312 start_codon:yes stop_codon:yes gene_type:complete